ncbi:MAG: WS/DGAT domain-containing protein, partial [Pseudomonadota bacterium]
GIAKAAARRLTKGEGGHNRAPFTRFNGDISPHRAFDATVFDLDEFKTVQRAFRNAKINDIVLAVCGGALRKYLESKNELPAESLIATAPINQRAQASDLVGAKADGNNVSAMTVPLFTNIADPTERLKTIVRATQSAKAGESGIQARLLTDVSRYMPAMSQSLITRFVLSNEALTQRSCNLFISNVAGPPVPLFFCGAQVAQQFGMAPIGGGVGLFIATPSYNGQITFAVTTTRDIVPDTPFLIDCIKDAFTELKSVAERQTTKSATKPRNADSESKYRVRSKPSAPSDTALAKNDKPQTKPRKRRAANAKANGEAKPSVQE